MRPDVQRPGAGVVHHPGEAQQPAPIRPDDAQVADVGGPEVRQAVRRGRDRGDRQERPEDRHESEREHEAVGEPSAGRSLTSTDPTLSDGVAVG